VVPSGPSWRGSLLRDREPQTGAQAAQTILRVPVALALNDPAALINYTDSGSSLAQSKPANLPCVIVLLLPTGLTCDRREVPW
jgi:hypothetical protein